MAPSRRSKTAATSTRRLPFSSSPISAISSVVVAQICLSTGYTSTEAPALRSLSSVMSHYIQTLVTSASSVAAHNGRSQSNLLDLIHALEILTISSHGGFPSASDPTTPLLRSFVLKDIRSFVRSIKEVPFPKPIPRRERDLSSIRVFPASFAAMGREPPAHVPRWLPCFPEDWKGKGEERVDYRKRWEEKGAIFKEDDINDDDDQDAVVEVGGLRGRNNGVLNKRILQHKEEEKELVSMFERERKKVRFELGFVNSSQSSRKKMKKRLVLCDEEEEE